MIVLNSLFPVFILIALGVVLKRAGLTDAVFLQKSDRLIYYIFFPLMLFYKIGGAKFGSGLDWKFYQATIGVVVLMFLLSTLVIRFGPITHFQAGTFSQSCYRFNTYIGVAVILNSLGEEGVAVLGILLGLVIPLINVFAVSILIWHSGEDLAPAKKVRVLVRALAANPLILGCLAGIVYARFIGVFPVFIDNTLALMSMVTLPMALLSIGGALSFGGVKRNLLTSFLAAGLKLLVLPLLGFIVYNRLGITGLPFKVGLIFFCLPASTAIYVLSGQLNSDTELASAAIVVSTLLSFFSLSAALLL